MINNFSPKQKLAALWAVSEKYGRYDGIICDGAVRSGKTFACTLGFIMWSMQKFDGKYFALCGKTIRSLKRNIVEPMSGICSKLGYDISINNTLNFMDVACGKTKNRYHFFGGKDESSSALIQGLTLAGVLFDETVLMPRGFVQQAVARCSVEGSKLWFNCNPESPYHWFKREWIDKCSSKNLLYLHFDLNDNPSLSEPIKQRYHRLYTGVFYERFVLGKWVCADGLIYPMFGESCICEKLPESFSDFAVSCDYGTVNPSSFGLWGNKGGVWYRISEYYYDARKQGHRRTDEEHYSELERLIGSRDVECVICDPSAASFIECIKRHGRFKVIPAKNDVVSGIRRVADALNGGQIKISSVCLDSIREFGLYRWDEKASKDVPIKENDHAMDDIRYFVTHFLSHKNEGAFFVGSLERH